MWWSSCSFFPCFFGQGVKYIGFLIMLGTFQLSAQKTLPLKLQDSVRMDRDLARTVAFVASNKLDSAFVLSEQLMDQLQQSGQMESPFGLQLQMVYGTALEHQDRDTMALQVLHHVQEVSKAKRLWATYTQTCVVIASLHEKIDRPEQAIANLRKAQVVFRQHGVDTIYPRFAIRISSWHRIFGDRDSAVFYAKEVLRTAPKYGQIFEEAEGNLLMGLLTVGSSYEKGERYLITAGKLYRKIDDFNGQRGIYTNLSMLHFKNGNYSNALVFSDSTLAIEGKIRAAGEKKIFGVYHSYLIRGDIYEAMGQHDSVTFYLRKGHRMQIDFIREMEKDKIVEIDGRYQDEKKVQQLKEQALQIELEQKRRNGVLGVSFIVLLLATGLSYFYWQLRKANKKTKEQSTQLKNLDAAKSRFFANVSHELRTPLTLMIGPIKSLLKENHLTKKQAQMLRMANQGGQNLQLLVNEIIDLGKMEAGKMETSTKPTQIAPFFRQYFAQFESLAEQKGVVYTYKEWLEEEHTALIDREKCRQVVYNLLSNAFKFTPSGGKVSVLVKMEGDQLQLKVNDTGKGIHPDDLPHVFDRYFQTNRPDATAAGGTGIGLALCQEYANLFGGSITVDSQLGKGSTFIIAFPLEIMPNQKGATYEDLSTRLASEYHGVKEKVDQLVVPMVQKAKGNRPTILVVEDNADLQTYIQMVLQDDYHILTAENGEKALAVLHQKDQPPAVDLIISDLMMPVMDGYQLLKKLKGNASTQQIPTIMLTARAGKDDRLKALRIGVDDYLTKPFDEEELKIRIKNLLKYQTARQEEAKEAPLQKDFSNISHTEQGLLQNIEDFVRKKYFQCPPQRDNDGG